MFQTYPELAAVVRKLRRLGAKPARMTGSGSAVFGVFESAAQVKRAATPLATPVVSGSFFESAAVPDRMAAWDRPGRVSLAVNYHIRLLLRAPSLYSAIDIPVIRHTLHYKRVDFSAQVSYPERVSSIHSLIGIVGFAYLPSKNNL